MTTIIYLNDDCHSRQTILYLDLYQNNNKFVFTLKFILMKQFFILATALLFVIACSNNKQTDTNTTESTATAPTTEDASTPDPNYDPHRGEGKFKDLDIPAKLNADMAKKGESVYSVKCASCHKLDAERLVGPGWKGVTERRTAEWLMNFVTNTDEMIEKDPELQAQLEICMVRMPNQNLSDDDARAVYEFMRKNDGVK